MKKNILIILSSLLILIGMSGLINWNNSVKKSSKIKNSTLKHVEKKKNELKIDFDSLIKENSDTVGYIEVNGTEVKYPVVKTTDNDFYLSHDFKKENNITGWIFADYRNKFDKKDKNIIIYGHNMKDGSMFGSLTKILSDQWYKNEENLYIPFSTKEENMLFKVFSIYQIEPEDYYIETEFKGSEFFSFTSILKSRSIYDFHTKVKKTDTILTLSTCTDSGDGRIVLHAVRVS